MTDPVEIFLSDIDKVGNKLNSKLSFLTSIKGLSVVELQQIVAELDFMQELNNFGYSNIVQKYINGYDSLISELHKEAVQVGVGKIAGATVQDLEVLRDLDGEALLRRGQMFSAQYKSSLLKSIVSGQTLKQIRDEILPQIQSEVPFRPSWFNSMVNTSYAQFDATAMTKLYEDTPEQKFILKHPYDERTRKQCIHAIELMKEYPEGLTKKQINNGILGEYESGGTLQKYDFVNRGGSNCRGNFRAKTKFSITKYTPKANYGIR